MSPHNMPHRHKGEEEVQFYSFVTLALDGGGGGVNAMPWLLYTLERAPVPIVQED
jgi:hypothetical protein